MLVMLKSYGSQISFLLLRLAKFSHAEIWTLKFEDSVSYVTWSLSFPRTVIFESTVSLTLFKDSYNIKCYFSKKKVRFDVMLYNLYWFFHFRWRRVVVLYPARHCPIVERMKLVCEIPIPIPIPATRLIRIVIVCRLFQVLFFRIDWHFSSAFVQVGSWLGRQTTRRLVTVVICIFGE